MSSDRNYSSVPGLITHQIYLHDKIKPAVYQATNGYKEWWLNNKLHRDNGPAVEHINGDVEYYQNGLRHREDGPAISFNYGQHQEYWLNGKQVTKEDINISNK